ncbi:prepilin-type N-terminal cleavage/methylation domain-containing protein [Vibrio barjaei]|uniref:prepilin-type N-terminal cleavage/methylation domain-containing protein n=1 Tax=Vibrio barjaei TaxID=1676683 RepID=UPI002283E63D|nr:prepilin-type N-terminal cleavage/methylation domain-containing protein [Vibrio barjaei]MCY9872991.1 prepilin-type N-terminal cleavage/methylation domain-containing protein [Vibrio barjaei]
MKIKKTNLGRQRGLTLIELAVVLVLVAIVILTTIKIVPQVQFSLAANELTQEIQEIRTAVLKWKSARPNYDGVTITKLCTAGRKLLNESICGAAGDGQGTVPWGGNYSVSAVTANKSQFVITIGGLPGLRVFELADSVAPMSSKECTSADSCTSIGVTGSGIDDFNAQITVDMR